EMLYLRRELGCTDTFENLDCGAVAMAECALFATTAIFGALTAKRVYERLFSKNKAPDDNPPPNALLVNTPAPTPLKFHTDAANSTSPQEIAARNINAMAATFARPCSFFNLPKRISQQ